jgi:hypothetical protein
LASGESAVLVTIVPALARVPDLAADEVRVAGEMIFFGEGAAGVNVAGEVRQTGPRLYPKEISCSYRSALGPNGLRRHARKVARDEHVNVEL